MSAKFQISVTAFLFFICMILAKGASAQGFDNGGGLEPIVDEGEFLEDNGYYQENNSRFSTPQYTKMYEIDRSDEAPREEIVEEPVEKPVEEDNEIVEETPEEDNSYFAKMKKDAARRGITVIRPTDKKEEETPKIDFTNVQIIELNDQINSVKTKFGTRFIIKLVKEENRQWNFEPSSTIIDLRQKEETEKYIALEYVSNKRGTDRLYFDLIDPRNHDVQSKILNIKVE